MEKSLKSNTGYTVEYWNAENGLPQNSVSSIAQTSDGFLWIGTYNGLTRFDGVKMVTYHTKNTKGLLSNGATGLSETPFGLLFIDMNGNLMKFQSGEFSSFFDNSKFQFKVNSYTVAKPGKLIFCTKDGNVYEFQKEHPVLLEQFGMNNHINILYSEKEGIYVQTDSAVFVIKNYLIHKITKLPDMIQNMMFLQPDNSVCITGDRGVYRVNGDVCTKISLPIPIQPYRVFTNKRNMFLAGNLYTGAMLIEDNKIQTFNVNNGLTSNAISALFIDKENNIWIGTNDAGINKLKKKSFLVYSKEDGLAGDAVGPILRTSKNEILISSFCDGISKFKDNKFLKEKFWFGDCNWSLLEDFNQNLWLGFYKPDLVLLGNDKPRHFTMKDGLPDNSFFSLFEDSKKTIWIGTGSGICYFKDGKFEIIKHDKLEKSKVTFIKELNFKEIWVGTDHGFFILHGDKIKHYDVSNGLPNNNVRFIHLDSDGTYWICTYGGGLCRFKNGILTSFPINEEIMDYFLSAMIEDKKGNFWITSNRGIFSVQQSELNSFADGKSGFFKPVYYGKEDGLQNDEFNGGFQPSFAYDGAKYWLPTIKGVVVTDLNNVQTDNFIPELFIEKILVDNIHVDLQEPDFSVNHNVRSFDFYFNAPKFSGISNVIFQYQVEGVDNDWSKPTRKRSVKYFDILPGKYKFKVRLFGSLNSKINKEVNIGFNVLYPFWQSTLFYILITILFLSVIMLISYHLITKKRKRIKNIKEIGRQRKILEINALRLKINFNLMVNCINYFKLKNDANLNEYSHSFLMKISEIVNKVDRSSQINVSPISEEIDLLKDYLNFILLYSSKKFDYKIIINEKGEFGKIDFPVMILVSVAEYFVNNTPADYNQNDKLTISFSVEDNYLVTIFESTWKILNNEENSVSLKATSKVETGIALIVKLIELSNQVENYTIQMNFDENFKMNNKIVLRLNMLTLPE